MLAHTRDSTPRAQLTSIPGIRYAKPTNGSLRFRAPQRAAILPSNTTFNASRFSPGCPNLGPSAGPGLPYGDDCLSLNIWSPATNRLNSTEGASVLVWIYGGGFFAGSSSVPIYNANNFVRDQEDLIVVTINYRLLIYGFPAGSGQSSTQLNAGLQDQRMAIEWVYNNIRNFGGDPSKITLFGESAGASSIGAYAYAYWKDPIARGFILESGSEYLNTAITVPINNNASITGWNTVAQKIGCNSTDSSKVFACMQAANLSVLADAVNNYPAARSVFLPTQDGVLLQNASTYTALAQAGQFAQVPVLIGTNNNEGTILTTIYAGGLSNLADIITQGFTCSAANVAMQRRNASVPIWQYRYFGTFPPSTPINSTLGAYHGSEMAVVFGTYTNGSRAENMTSKVMQDAWTAFAKDPTTGLTEYGWPQYESNGTTLIQLASNYFNQSQAVLDAGALPVVTFNNSQAYNSVCSSAN
ncbi:protein of unknown function [Taphrina deformans PYCC 5710]|uniref:Carboxylic ester hydrolase n=1 Tax=Taphrina deformans (strain PYCC 5710 / ATCC 11124 / CBS 356.35 / IMI 108563 / JCM 9778 / NBRC 8474) TaxID=1097556 RepID=R4XCV0_TAPDE|nr:protein of unknown function [Taphrina deformans PYCC 5710]|eukprot:CCG83695.1 protein of unknown function [Taphrina deformans PYCC 5710]